MTKIPDL